MAPGQGVASKRRARPPTARNRRDCRRDWPGRRPTPAGVTLAGGDLRGVVAAIDLSRATLRKIRQNLFWALAYNTLGIPFAALGLLHPLIAGAAMALSSVSVTTNSTLLKRFDPMRRFTAP